MSDATTPDAPAWRQVKDLMKKQLPATARDFGTIGDSNTTEGEPR